MQRGRPRLDAAAGLVLAAAFACPALGCGAAAPPPAITVDVGGDAPPPPAVVVAGAPTEGSSAVRSSIAWTTSESEARDRARREDRPLLIFADAAWCVPCRELEAGLFTEPRVIAAARGAVALRLDVTDVDDPLVARAMERLGARGLPLVVVLGPEGRERFRAESLPVDSEALERALTE